MKSNILSLLGLAMKAGKCVSGEFTVEKTVKDRKAKLVVIAVDASAASKKNYKDMCTFYHVPLIEEGTKEDLGHCIGKEFRAAVAVCDTGFAEGIIKKATQREEHR